MSGGNSNDAGYGANIGRRGSDINSIISKLDNFGESLRDTVHVLKPHLNY